MARLDPQRYNLKNYADIQADLSYDFLGNRFTAILRTDSSNVTEYIIPFEYAYRDDLIAKAFYGTSELSWIIHAYNSILYMEELTNGAKLRLPSLADIELAIRKYRRL